MQNTIQQLPKILKRFGFTPSDFHHITLTDRYINLHGHEGNLKKKVEGIAFETVVTHHGITRYTTIINDLNIEISLS